MRYLLPDGSTSTSCDMICTRLPGLRQTSPCCGEMLPDTHRDHTGDHTLMSSRISVTHSWLPACADKSLLAVLGRPTSERTLLSGTTQLPNHDGEIEVRLKLVPVLCPVCQGEVLCMPIDVARSTDSGKYSHGRRSSLPECPRSELLAGFRV